MGYPIISLHICNKQYINTLRTEMNFHNMMIISSYNELTGEDEIPHLELNRQMLFNIDNKEKSKQYKLPRADPGQSFDY